MNKKFTTYIENLKNFKIGPITFINITILLAIISFILSVGSAALFRVTYPVFSPINGDYQTYNGIRRLLDGQIPFKDFYYYLGFGPLYITSILTALFGGSFHSSLIATHLQPLVLFIGIYFLLGIMEKSKSSRIIVALICTFFAGDLMIVDNSLRFWRVFSVIPIAIVFSHSLNPGKNYVHRGLLLAISCGILSIWSNDYGFALLPIYPTMFILYLFFKEKKSIKSLAFLSLSMILLILISNFLIVSLLTLGNYFNWFSFTKEAGTAQVWYYHYFPFFISQHIPIFFNQLLNSKILIILIIFLGMMIFRFSRSSYTYFTLSLHITLASFMYFYTNGNIISQGSNMLIILLVGVIVLFIFKSINKKSPKLFTTIILVTAFILSGLYLRKIPFSSVLARAMAVKQQGIITGYQNEIIEFQKVIGTNTTFSSYPTAYEDRSQKFNPSQIDYVIHALGKKNTTQYKNEFINENPRYFLNPTIEWSYWQPWIWFANFELYELVFANYKPILLNDFGVIWEKQTTKNANLVNVPEPKISILNNNTENITIEVSYPPNILPKDFPFYMTVISVDYETIPKEGVPFYHKNMKYHVNFHYNYESPYELAYLISSEEYGVSKNFSRPGDGKLNVPVMIDKNGVGKVFIAANTYNINIKSVDYVSTLKQYIFVRGLLKDQKGVQDIDGLIQQYNLTNK